MPLLLTRIFLLQPLARVPAVPFLMNHLVSPLERRDEAILNAMRKQALAAKTQSLQLDSLTPVCGKLVVFFQYRDRSSRCVTFI